MPTVFLLREDPAEEELIVLIFAVWLALLLGYSHCWEQITHQARWYLKLLL